MDATDSSQPALTPENPPVTETEDGSKRLLAIVIIISVVVLAGIVFGVVALSGMDSNGTGRIRDIFIIFMAVEFLIIGIALVVLIIQLASLINLLNNEVRPILKSTTDTVNTLKGTTQFLSDNMVEPVIKLNEYLAGLKKMLDVINIFK
jgi:hypothetical protein